MTASAAWGPNQSRAGGAGSSPSGLDRRGIAGPLLVALLGAVLLATGFVNFWAELTSLRFRLPPLLAVLLVILPALGLLVVAWHLFRGEFTPRHRLVVAGACYAGTVLFGVFVFLTVLIRVAEGLVVEEPQLPLLIGAAVGGIAGSFIGLLFVRLRRSAEAAEHARERLAFVNTVLRHDVLNGISVITARAELIEDDEETARAIHSQGEQLADLVERTRSIIRALDEDERIAREPVDLGDVVETEVGRLSESFPAATVDADVPAGLTVLATDALADVVWNVLTNAVEHHDGEEPSIEVTATTEDGTVRLQIVGDGPGIPESKRERLSEGRRPASGSGGFGLFFVTTMVEAWGGTVRIEDNDSRGTVVGLELQRAES